MRLFVAVYPPESALDHLAAAVGRLRLGQVAADGTNVRLARRPLWHITLVFLGEVADDRAPAAAESVQAGVARWRAASATAPVLQLAGGGRFGRGRTSVIWIGVAGEIDPLYRLTRSVRRSLRAARLGFDRKPFRPHLTIARPGDRLPATDLAADVAALAGYAGPVWPAEQVRLVRSLPGPNPVHEPLATVPLT
ncbi:MAG: RNA 2',3'-cyclic phosphodiesterase [Micromonosporaceae bacterium]|nr:RNA 2',3'-cyclic phosphodiesterase [Micromonosporaceae bacterium]